MEIINGFLALEKTVMSEHICNLSPPQFYYRYPISYKNAKKDKFHLMEIALLG